MRQCCFLLEKTAVIKVLSEAGALGDAIHRECSVEAFETHSLLCENWPGL